MKMITEYLDHAITFERMAAEEDDPVLTAKFEKQATAYRKLAVANDLYRFVPTFSFRDACIRYTSRRDSAAHLLSFDHA